MKRVDSQTNLLLRTPSNSKSPSGSAAPSSAESSPDSRSNARTALRQEGRPRSNAIVSEPKNIRVVNRKRFTRPSTRLASVKDIWPSAASTGEGRTLARRHSKIVPPSSWTPPSFEDSLSDRKRFENSIDEKLIDESQIAREDVESAETGSLIHSSSPPNRPFPATPENCSNFLPPLPRKRANALPQLPPSIGEDNPAPSYIPRSPDRDAAQKFLTTMGAKYGKKGREAAGAYLNNSGHARASELGYFVKKDASKAAKKAHAQEATQEQARVAAQAAQDLSEKTARLKQETAASASTRFANSTYAGLKSHDLGFEEVTTGKTRLLERFMKYLNATVTNEDDLNGMEQPDIDFATSLRSIVDLSDTSIKLSDNKKFTEFLTPMCLQGTFLPRPSWSSFRTRLSPDLPCRRTNSLIIY